MAITRWFLDTRPLWQQEDEVRSPCGRKPNGSSSRWSPSLPRRSNSEYCRNEYTMIVSWLLRLSCSKSITFPSRPVANGTRYAFGAQQPANHISRGYIITFPMQMEL